MKDFILDRETFKCVMYRNIEYRLSVWGIVTVNVNDIVDLVTGSFLRYTVESVNYSSLDRLRIAERILEEL
jgi:hypothetical protein